MPFSDKNNFNIETNQKISQYFSFAMTDLQRLPILNLGRPKRVSMRKGRWSTQEKLKFKEGLQLFGKNWKKIQSYIRSRSLLQIRSHAQKHFLMEQKLAKLQRRNKVLGRSFEQSEFKNKQYQKIPFQSQGSPTAEALPNGQYQQDFAYGNGLYANNIFNNNLHLCVAPFVTQTAPSLNLPAYPSLPCNIQIVNPLASGACAYPFYVCAPMLQINPTVELGFPFFN